MPDYAKQALVNGLASAPSKPAKSAIERFAELLGLQLPPAPPAPTDETQDAWAKTQPNYTPPEHDTIGKGMDFLRGVTGFGEQGPPGMTWTNAGQVLGAISPFLPGKVGLGGLYSRLTRAAESMPERFFAPQVEGIVKKGLAGMEEFNYRKLPEFLQSQGPKQIQKEALINHLTENPAPDVSILNAGERAGAGTARPEFHDSDTKFAKYTLPHEGGISSTSNPPPGYQEELFQLKSKPPTTEQLQDYFYKKYASRVSPEETQRYINDNELTGYHSNNPNSPESFIGPHWDDPNFAHTRSSRRELPDIGHGDLIEETQSDLHQQAKTNTQDAKGRLLDTLERGDAPEQEIANMKNEIGYAGYLRADTPTSGDIMKALHEKDAADDALGQLIGYGSVFGDAPEIAKARAQVAKDSSPDNAALIDEALNRYVTAHDNYQKVDALHTASSRAVPDVPFKESWPELTLKHHLMKSAHDPESNWVGFTGGDVQNERYRLNQQADSIMYNGNTGQLLVMGIDGRPLIDEIATPRKLRESIGAEAAKKLMSLPARPGFSGDGGGWRVLDGDGLILGGEGMKEFYDKLLPKRLQKIVQPLGGAVESMEIPQETSTRFTVPPTPPAKGWMVRMTPELRARLLKEGLPLMTLGGLAAGATVSDTPEPH